MRSDRQMPAALPAPMQGWRIEHQIGERSAIEAERAKSILRALLAQLIARHLAGRVKQQTDGKDGTPTIGESSDSVGAGARGTGAAAAAPAPAPGITPVNSPAQQRGQRSGAKSNDKRGGAGGSDG